MTEYDDLEELERELGATLRTALRRDASVITGEPRLETHAMWRDRYDTANDAVMVVEVPRARSGRSGRRRWLVAAAVVMAGVVLISGTVLLRDVGDERSARLRPA